MHMKTRQYKFYFSETQKKLEDSVMGESKHTTTFKGQEYTECKMVESEFYSAGLLNKPHNERFPDSVYLGMGTSKDIKVNPNL